jgi:hypothetical protein
VVVIGRSWRSRSAADDEPRLQGANAKSPIHRSHPGFAPRPRTNGRSGGTRNPHFRPGSLSRSRTRAGARPAELLDDKTKSQSGAGQKSAVEGPGEKGDPAKPDAPKPGPAKDGGGNALGTGEDAPVVVEDEGKAPPNGKSSDIGGTKLEKDVEVGKTSGARPEPAPATLVWTYEVRQRRHERMPSSLYGERQMWKEDRGRRIRRSPILRACASARRSRCRRIR